MSLEAFQAAKILIVDDEQPNVRLLERLLQNAGYTAVAGTTDAREVVSLYLDFQPDLLLLDLMMPHLDGFQTMEQLSLLIPQGTYFPILVLTADITAQAKQRALAAGAKDFLTKPFDHTEVLLRIRNLIETRLLHLRLQNQNQLLEGTVRERTQELKATHIEVLERLARAAEFRDDDTGQHTQRVGAASARLAQQLGLPDDHVELIRRAAPLHDVGKIGISDTILLKPGRLTPEEFDIMKTHAFIGAALLAGGRSDLVRVAERIAGTHHERWDGSGYPAGLQGEDIPIEGRILAVVDVFDALTHERPYKKAWPVDEAVAEIERQSGKQFDPRVVEAFLRGLDGSE
jgi:putative two-component system response regulator